MDYEENGSSRLANLGAVTAPYVESTTYTALRDLSLTYSLGNLGEQLGVSDLQVGLALRNWWMDSDYTGLSPEVSQFGNTAVGGSVDTNPFPLSKKFLLNSFNGILTLGDF